MRPAPQHWRSRFLSALFLCIVGSAFSQTSAPPVNRALFIGGSGDGIQVPRLAATGDGNFYLYALGARPLIKFSNRLEVAWEIQRVAGSNDIEQVSALATLSDGGIIAVI